MVMLLVNFILVATMVAFAAIYESEEPVSKKKITVDQVKLLGGIAAGLAG